MSRATKVIRVIVFAILIAAIVAAVIWLFTTARGYEIRHHPHHLGHEFRGWVAHHRAIAPATYISLFIVLVVLMLPVWWLQILAGYGFGIAVGTLWGEIGAMLSALAAVAMSRWLAADYFHQKVEGRLQKLRELDEKLGHNGLLVVIVIRLMHFMPVGISNYVFGLTTITLRDVAVGTVLGGLPVVLWWAAVGAGVKPWDNWRFLTLIGAIHIVLLVPISLRYLKPQWFKKYGIE